MATRLVVSVLFNEPKLLKYGSVAASRQQTYNVSVLFNEPKLLKYRYAVQRCQRLVGFSALQRAEIAEIVSKPRDEIVPSQFQCSSTSRNC